MTGRGQTTNADDVIPSPPTPPPALKTSAPLAFTRPNPSQRRASGPILSFSPTTSAGTNSSIFGRSLGGRTDSSPSSVDLDGPPSFVALRSSSYGGMLGATSKPMARSSSSSTTSAQATTATSQSLAATGVANTPATSQAASTISSPAEPGRAAKEVARRPAVSRSASSDGVDVSPLVKRVPSRDELEEWRVDGEWSGENDAARPKPPPRANSHEGHHEARAEAEVASTAATAASLESYRATPDPYAPMTPVTSSVAPMVASAPLHYAAAPPSHYVYPGYMPDPSTPAVPPNQYAYGMPPMMVSAPAPAPPPPPSSWAWQAAPMHPGPVFPGGAHSRTPSVQSMDPMDPSVYANHERAVRSPPMMVPWSPAPPPVHHHHHHIYGAPPRPVPQHYAPDANPYYAGAYGGGAHSRQSSFGSHHSRAPSHGSSFNGATPGSPFNGAYGFPQYPAGHQRQGSSTLRMGRAYHSPAPSASSINFQRLSLSSASGVMDPRSGHTSMPSTSSSVMTSGPPSIASTRSPLLEEFRFRSSKGAAGRKFELTDIKGCVVEFSTDQHGSRFAQEKLDTASDEERQAVLDEVLPSIRTLMGDVFGNYVVQKLFEHGSAAQRSTLVSEMAGHVLELSLGTYGCRVVQKALDHVDAAQQLLLADELRPHVLQCVRDQNANHVVQKMVERINDKEAIGFVAEAFAGRVAELASHCYSCRVLQRIFEHCPESQSRPLMDEMQRDAIKLCQDQYGNYVVQWVLQKGQARDRQSVIDKVKGRLLTLSTHKFASNVVEEVLRAASKEERRALIEELLVVGPSPASPQPTCGALLLMLDQYGNYVLQRCIEVAEPSQRERLVEVVRPQLAHARRYGGGHAKHLAAIDKLLAKAAAAAAT